MSNDSSHADQMPAPRTPLNIAVEFRKNYARKATSGILKNISISGAFIAHSGSPIKNGEKLSLTFQVAGRERNIQAQVVWNNSHGCGIKFLPQNQRDVQIVDDLIYFVETRRTGTRDLLDKILKRVA